MGLIILTLLGLKYLPGWVKLVWLFQAILNNIKNVLSEKGVMSKWLAKQLQKDPATVSKWCNNHSQPDLYTFVRIANLLDVDVHELICHTKK